MSNKSKLKSLVMEIVRDKSRKKRRLSENLTVDNDTLKQYLGTAIETSGGNGELSGYTVYDFANSEMQKAKTDLSSFLQRAEGLLPEDVDMTQVAHDFWLSRNGHGAGFFDADYVDRNTGKQLQVIAKKFPEVNVVVGDDGKLYFE